MNTSATNSSDVPFGRMTLTRRAFVRMPGHAGAPIVVRNTTNSATKERSLWGTDTLACVAMGATFAAGILPHQVEELRDVSRLASGFGNETTANAQAIGFGRDQPAATPQFLGPIEFVTAYPTPDTVTIFPPGSQWSATQAGPTSAAGKPAMWSSEWGYACTRFSNAAILAQVGSNTTPVTLFTEDEVSVETKVGAEATGAGESGDLERAIRKVVSFAELRADWAGPDTELPSAEVRAQAIAFLRQLPRGVLVPHVAPGAEGAIGLEWETRRDFIAVEFTPDGLIWHHRRDRQFTGGEEIQWSGAIPPSLLEQLERSFG